MGHFTTIQSSCQIRSSPSRRLIPKNRENRSHHRVLTIRDNPHNQQRMDRERKRRLLSATEKTSTRSCNGHATGRTGRTKGEGRLSGTHKGSQLIRYAYIVGKHQCHCTSRDTSLSAGHQTVSLIHGSVTNQDWPVFDHKPNQFQLQ